MSALRTLGFLFAGALALSSFATAAADTGKNASAKAAIAAAVNGDWRKPADKERDQYRHPAEALEFWGLEPGMTILEIQPGGGWWTDILAPFARATGGQYYATSGNAQFESKLTGNPELYGKPKFVSWGAQAEPLPKNTFDFILTARSVHGWLSQGTAEKNFKELARGLKPGGILALEQHRAKPGKDDPKASTGYVTEARVIELAKQAGLELVAKSEINANPKDTADHPFGVWTLPPTRRTRPYSEGASAHDPNFDRTKYDAIGESDRMTLKFTKPR